MKPHTPPPLAAALFALGLGLAAPAAEALTLKWDGPVANADTTGTPLTDLAGYRLYRATTPGQYGNAPVKVIPATTPGGTVSADVDGLAPGVHYFVVTAFDSSGNESTRSNEIRVEVPPNTSGFTLTVALSGSGTVASSPAGIDCGADCSETYAAGTLVTLTSRPAANQRLQGWGGSCGGTGNTCVVTMSEARNVTASFIPQSGGGETIEQIIAAMPPNSWKALPNTQMKDVCPQPYSAYYCSSVIAAWSGGTYDDKRDRMIVYGGGHADSWYNNLFAFDLGTMKWQRLTEMGQGATGTAPGNGWNDMRFETCAFYPKGKFDVPAEVMRGNYIAHEKCFVEPVVSMLDQQQPRSAHTYGRVVFDRVRDRYCHLGGGFYPSAQTGSQVVACFNPETRLWERAADLPTNVMGRGQSALDAAGNIWAVTAEGGPVGRYDPRTNSWSTYGYTNYEAGGGTDVDRKRNHLYTLYPTSQNTYQVRRWDLNSPTSLNARPNYTIVPTTGDALPNLGTRPGTVYLDAKDRFFVWGGGRDVYTYDPATQAWQRQAATGDDPGAQQKWGTYGRFRYSPQRGVFVLVNSTTQDVFIYKPAN